MKLALLQQLPLVPSQKCSFSFIFLSFFTRLISAVGAELAVGAVGAELAVGAFVAVGAVVAVSTFLAAGAFVAVVAFVAAGAVLAFVAVGAVGAVGAVVALGERPLGLLRLLTREPLLAPAVAVGA